MVAGLVQSPAMGERGLADLKAAGFTRVELIQVGSGPVAYDIAKEKRTDSPSVAPAGASSSSATSIFFRERASSATSFIDGLIRLKFSGRDAQKFADGVVAGQALVMVDAGAALGDAVAILTRYKAVVRSTGEAADAIPVPEAKDDDLEIRLRAEELVIDKQRVQHGEARIRKEVVTEIQSFDIPVTHEELVIERHAVAGTEPGDTISIEAETIRIPLTEERVSITKDTVVREEVQIGKRRVQGVEHVSETLRHEELRVDDASARKPPST